MSSKGWIKLYRSSFNNRMYFAEPFTRWGAWCDLLLVANHEEGYIRKRGIRQPIYRGQVGYSFTELANRWRWSVGKVNRFLNELALDKQIVLQKTNITTLISIVNYELYQSGSIADNNANDSANGIANGMQTVSQTEANKNIKNNNNDKNINNKINTQGEFSSPRTPESVPGFNYLPDGRSYIEPTFFYKASDFNGLPEQNLLSVIDFFKATKNIEIEPERVKTVWNVFKTQELTEQKPYRNRDDVYRHFLNWCKKQSFAKEKIARKTYQKEKTDVKVVGIEFINNFSQCKMSDGSIQDLDVNQRDLAKYNHINPSSITKK